MATNSLAMHRLIALCDSAAHEALTFPLTESQAHDEMQIHVACRAKRCPRKQAAIDTLVEAGRMVPSTSQPR